MATKSNTTREIEFLKEKSVASFLMAIEIFNKPTINYRLEGCVFFLCNAWELLLKAKLLKDGISIKYKKSNRTISLNDAISKVMTNDKDPIRINLNVIISLRNTSTHYIFPEFEMEYIPFLAYNTRAYAEKSYDFFEINLNSYIKTDFLSLFTATNQRADINILKQYGKGVADYFKLQSDSLNKIMENHGDKGISLGVQLNIVRINNKSEADMLVYQTNNPKDQNIKYIPKLVNPNQSHTFTHHSITNEIDKIIKKENIHFTPIRVPTISTRNPNPNIFTTACFDKMCKIYSLKEDEQFCVKIMSGKNNIYKYSNALITKIISIIQEDGECLSK